MSVPASNVGASNPFPGLLSYTKSSAWKLFGRNADCSLMITRVLSGRTTLLFAGTGVGKTSFLDAKLAPNCESRFAIVAHRTWAGDAPLALLKKSVCAELNGQVEPSHDLPYLLAQVTARHQRPVLLILDQFEEVFQHHRDTVAIREFQDVLVKLINDTTQDLRFILSMREEFLGELSVFENSIPDPFYNYYHLKNLSPEQAAEVIEATASTVKTAAGTPVECDSARLGRLIRDLKKIPGEGKGEASGLERDFVPPPYLQIVCHRLWSGTRPEETGKLFLSEYHGGTALDEFHAYCKEKLEMPEEEKEVVAEAFGFLMSKSGAKMAYELGDLARLLRVDPAPLARALGRLSDPEVRILRSFPDPDKKPWFELYHDMYAPFLMNWKAEQDVRKKRRLQKLERQAEIQRKQLERQKELEARHVQALKREREEARKRKRALLWNRLVTIALFAGLFGTELIVNPWRDARTIKDATDALSDRSAVQVISNEKVRQAYLDLQKNSFVLAVSPSFRPNRLWSLYWGARADAEAREENRDPALLFDLKTLAEVPAYADPTRAWRAKMLMGGNYGRLIHSYPVESAHTFTGLGPLATISPDGVLATVYDDGTVRRWNTASGETLPAVVLQAERADTPGQGPGPEQARSGGGSLGRILALSPRGDYVAVQVSTNAPAESRHTNPAGKGTKSQNLLQIAVFDLKSGKQVFHPLQLTTGGTMRGSAFSLLRPTFSPDGSMLAVAGATEIQLCPIAAASNTARGEPACGKIPLPVEKTKSAPFFTAAFSPDGKQLAVATHQQITLWALEKETPPRLLQTRHYPSEPARLASFSPRLPRVIFLDNGVLAASIGQSLRVWDQHGEIAQDFALPATIQQMAFSRKEKTIVTATGNGRLYACNLASGKSEAVGTVDSAAWGTVFSPDAESFLSFQPDYGFRQWTVRGGLDSAKAAESQYSGSSGAISPDGKHVAILGDVALATEPGNIRNSGPAGAELTVYSVTSHSAVLATKLLVDEDSLEGEAFAFLDNGSILVDEGRTFRRFTFDGKEPQDIAKSSEGESLVANRSSAYLRDAARNTCRAWDAGSARFAAEFARCKSLVSRSNGDVGVFYPATGLTFRHWDGKAWQQEETVPLSNGDDISALTFGPGVDMLTVAEGRWTIVYRLDPGKRAPVKIATWRNKFPGAQTMFQLKESSEVFVVGQSWLHRINRVDEDSISSIDLPDTNIFPGAGFSDDDRNKVKVLRKAGQKLVVQELDLTTPPKPDPEQTDWAALFRAWQQKLGYSVADDGTLAPQGTKSSTK